MAGHANDRRRDLGVTEIDLRRGHGGLRRVDVRLGGEVVLELGLVFLLADSSAFNQRGVAIQILLRALLLGGPAR